MMRFGCIIEDWRTHGITDLLGVCPWLEQKSWNSKVAQKSNCSGEGPFILTLVLLFDQEFN